MHTLGQVCIAVEVGDTCTQQPAGNGSLKKVEEDEEEKEEEEAEDNNNNNDKEDGEDTNDGQEEEDNEDEENYEGDVEGKWEDLLVIFFWICWRYFFCVIFFGFADDFFWICRQNFSDLSTINY